MHDDFGVAGGLKNLSALFAFVTQIARVGQRAIVCERHLPTGKLKHQRLSVRLTTRPAGRITHVPDGMGKIDSFEGGLIEDLVDEAHSDVAAHLLAIGRADASRLLPAMLLCVQPQVRHQRCLLVPPDTEQPAVMSDFAIRHEQNPCWHFTDWLDAAARSQTSRLTPRGTAVHSLVVTAESIKGRAFSRA